MQAIKMMGGPFQHLQHPLSANWKQGDLDKKIDIQKDLPNIIAKSILIGTIPLIASNMYFTAKIISFNNKKLVIAFAALFVTSFYLLTLAKKVQQLNKGILEETKEATSELAQESDKEKEKDQVI